MSNFEDKDLDSKLDAILNSYNSDRQTNNDYGIPTEEEIKSVNDIEDDEEVNLDESYESNLNFDNTDIETSENQEKNEVLQNATYSSDLENKQEDISIEEVESAQNNLVNSDSGDTNSVTEENSGTTNTNKVENSLSHLDMTKLDKKSREILEDTDETDYTFKLQDFEGPLDLLVHLITITKIDIRDIFISNITEQYMEMMKEIDTIDVEKASEFIRMAATLLEIKSKHLLPKPEEFDDGEDTSEEDFYRMIEEYKLIKDEMEKLAEIENVNSFYKAPDSTVGEFRYELPETLSVDAMIKAFTSLMQKVSIKAEAVVEKKIEKDRFTVSQKIAQIKDTLILQDRFMFSDLFEEDYSKSEIINTFLALLELLKRQYIYVEQNNLFDDITIIRNDDIEARLTEDIGSEYDKVDGEDE